MSTIDYIDLSDCDSKISKQLPVIKLNGVNIKKPQFPHRPKSMALKCIGLSCIKIQFGDKLKRTPTTSNSQNGNKKIVSKSDLWNSAWIDDQNPLSSAYPIRYLLEQKYDKTFKCPYNRSIFCQCSSKMTRISWINHIRRGHTRIDYDWRKTMKKNPISGITSIFEVFCVLCSKNKITLPISPHEFIQHIKKHHTNFLPYIDYFSYFQRCYICNDETKSFQQNISHRQMCITAVNKEPNQFGTINFNNCFKTLHGKVIVSIEMENDPAKSFENKLRSYKYFKRTTIHYWISSKKNDTSKLEETNTNVNCNPQSYGPKPNGTHVMHYKQNSDNNAMSISSPHYKILRKYERIPPGSAIHYNINIDKLLIPVPFQLKNDSQIKEAFIQWNKRIRPKDAKITKVNPWYCELCNAMLKNTATAYSHIRMCHPGARFGDSQCKTCNKRFITMQGYRNHYLPSKTCPVARKCGICGLTLTLNDIYHHLFDKHRNNFSKVLQLSTCLICRKQITDLNNHLYHVHSIFNTFHDTSPSDIVSYRTGTFFNCSKCSWTFFTEIELRNHMIISKHHLDCEYCPEMKFYYSWELINHNNLIHHNGECYHNLICEICSCNNDDEEIQFSNPSEKVEHFLKEHNCPCRVVLTNVEDGN